ncbi:MAG: 3-methyl-2-oxobutanoate hydroxymethyltransferase [Bdellovibrionota bacterium]
MAKHPTIKDFIQSKGKEKLAVLTAYDAQMAKILEQVGIDIILVGDSLGNVMLGHPNTLRVRMEDMIHHTRAVTRSATQSFVVADMPFGSYQESPEQAFRNACRLISEGGAQAIKLEGGKNVAPMIEKITSNGIPVMAHIGLTPQYVHQLGGFAKQGKTEQTAGRIFQDALAVEKAGAFSVVIECTENTLTKKITQELHIPTIGIGSGDDCDGQVLVINDLLGLATYPIPSFAKPRIDLRSIIAEQIQGFITDTKSKV